jgi:hypothetical protein
MYGSPISKDYWLWVVNEHIQLCRERLWRFTERGSNMPHLRLFRVIDGEFAGWIGTGYVTAYGINVRDLGHDLMVKNHVDHNVAHLQIELKESQVMFLD